MNPVYYYLDPAFFVGKEIQNYMSDDLLNKLSDLYLILKNLENRLFREGDFTDIFKFPIMKDIVDKCIMDIPATNQKLSRKFWPIFHFFYSKYFSYCNKPYLKDLCSFYINPDIPDEIQQEFNRFLNSCINLRDNSCECKNPQKTNPIFISSKTKINLKEYFTPFQNYFEVIKFIPILNFFPCKIDKIEVKDRKLRFILLVNYFKKLEFEGLISEDFSIENLDLMIPEYSFNSSFWKSEYFYSNNRKLQFRILEVMTDLLKHPGKIKNERKILKNLTIRIEDSNKNIEQCYIFHSLDLNGIKIYPRLRFVIHDNVIYFIDIINQH